MIGAACLLSAVVLIIIAMLAIKDFKPEDFNNENL